MSYHIGQFRRNQQSSYAVALNMELNYQQTDGTVTFCDVCGNLSGINIVDDQNSYYLRFGVKQRSDSEQIFYLKLKNTSETTDNEQVIEEFKVDRGIDTIYFQIILSPNATYNQIVWELQRTALDHRILNNDGTYGRKMEITLDIYTRLINIIKVLDLEQGLTRLTKIGIQGPPSLLMCINREQIRLGRTGIYEINNGIDITSISFVPKGSNDQNNLDYFIMDFEY